MEVSKDCGRPEDPLKPGGGGEAPPPAGAGGRAGGGGGEEPLMPGGGGDGEASVIASLGAAGGGAAVMVVAEVANIAEGPAPGGEEAGPTAGVAQECGKPAGAGASSPGKGRSCRKKISLYL